MPWQETNAVEQRLRFVREAARGQESVSRLCRCYRISRPTGYKWLARYEAGGRPGLQDRSSAPREHPNAVPDNLIQMILQARARHPTWGPLKLLVPLRQQLPRVQWPAASTISLILQRYGLSHRPKRRRRAPPHEQPFATCEGPNSVWCVDFKGYFHTTDGTRIDPLTISDAYSRYILCCQAVARPDLVHVQPLFEAVFRRYGLPRAIRTDNGAPFASYGPAGLSRLSVWWMRLGIRPERITPGRPSQNGRHERMHLTLKQETARPPAATAVGQQRRFGRFRHEFNEQRPHQALGQQTPGSIYVPSERAYPERLTPPEYPGYMIQRRVQRRGEFYWASQAVFASEALAGQTVGLEAVGERQWRVWFLDVPVGLFTEGATRVYRDPVRRRQRQQRPFQ
jgi:putative transposase